MRDDLRVGRRAVERRAPGGRWRDVEGLTLLVVGLVASTALFVWLLVRWLGVGGADVGAFYASSAFAGQPPSVDFQVNHVMSQLPDGRQARGSFVLRMREEAAPSQLATIARHTPTPVREGPSGIPQPSSRPGPSESLVRERVAAAMGSLGYEDVKGEAGKDRLKREVQRAVNESLPEAPVIQVFVREYLVQ